MIPKVLKVLNSYYEKTTPGTWKFDGVTISSENTDLVGDIVCMPPDEGEESLEYWPYNEKFIREVHNRWPEIMRLFKEKHGRD